MANKKAGVAFLIMFVIIVSFLAYQVNNYFQAQEQKKIVDERLAAAEQHFSDAKATADNYLANQNP